MLFRRYRGEPGRTAVALRGGWLHTGDLGRIHHDGPLVVLGRVDDLVISGGVNVHPDEVEAVLADHPGVAEVAVAGRADPRMGAAGGGVRGGAGPGQAADLGGAPGLRPGAVGRGQGAA
jgi:acyl-CoA synthetase (AMP-forming)/AMP-acid ligase II